MDDEPTALELLASALTDIPNRMLTVEQLEGATVTETSHSREGRRVARAETFGMHVELTDGTTHNVRLRRQRQRTPTETDDGWSWWEANVT